MTIDDANGSPVNSERLRILQMLEDGKMTADEATQLLSAIGAVGATEAGPIGRPGGSPRWLRIRVTDAASSRPRVDVTVPTSLVTALGRLGSRFMPPEAGVDIHQVLDAIGSGTSGRIVDVRDHDDDTHVEIFLE